MPVARKRWLSRFQLGSRWRARSVCPRGRFPDVLFEPPFAYRRAPVFHRFALMSIDGHVSYLRAGVPGLKSTSASGARRLAQDLAGALEDRIQHRYRQAPREGVLLTRVIGGDQTHVPEV